jgi:hypothetical protein
LDAKVDIEVDNLHVKRIDIEYLLGYVYIVKVDWHFKLHNAWVDSEQYIIIVNYNLSRVFVKSICTHP